MKIKNASGILLLIVIPFILLELVFRLLPVSYPPYNLTVSAETPVARYQPNWQYRFSTSWNFSIQANKSSNNYGYINQLDYDADDPRPLMMVIGDSFVEAHRIASGKTAAELLYTSVKTNGRVYSMGMSGAPLSQYLVFAEYSKNTFRPESMVFVIIGNDFDESLLKYYKKARFHLFEESGDALVLKRADYELTTVRKLIRKSAFIRYVMLNLKVKASLMRYMNKSPPARSGGIGGNVKFDVRANRVKESIRATDEFFKQLPLRTGLDAADILFVIDGLRPALYFDDQIEQAQNKYSGIMKRYFKKQALALGYEVVDMQPVFIERNRLDGAKFEFETDRHWNELGHSLVAEEVKKSAVFDSTFQGKTNQDSNAL